MPILPILPPVFFSPIACFVNGISGRKLQSPFASPPGIGESSPLVNVIWGLINLFIGYLLLTGVGNLKLGLSLDALVFGLGIVLISLILARHFGRLLSS